MATKAMTVFRQGGEDFTINDPNITNEFDPTVAYAAGEYANYQGNLYLFTEDHPAGAWNASHVRQVKLGKDVTGLKSALAYQTDKNIAGSLVSLQAEIKNSFEVHPSLTRGKKFDATGWHNTYNSDACTNIIPAGHVVVQPDSTFSATYFWSSYEYISDSEGYARYAQRTTSGDAYYARPVVINIQRQNGGGMSDENMEEIISHLKITYYPIPVNLGNAVGEMERIILGEKNANIKYTKGVGFFEDGYVSSPSYNCSSVITPTSGGERFIIEPTADGISAGIRFIVYEYVDDTHGTMIYTTRTTKADHVYTSPFIVSVAVGQSVTDSIYGALPYYIKIYSYNDKNCKELLLKSESTQNIIFIGDSIFGLERGETSIPALVGNYTGANTYNCALGGTAGSEEPDADWKWFDFTELSKAIATGDYTNQEAHESASGIPSYFSDVIDQLQAIDFSGVDLICLTYGGNDYNHAYCTASEFVTAMVANINRILTTYPNIRFVCMTPPYKYFMNAQHEFVNDGDTKENTNGETLRDFVDAYEQISKQAHVMVVNAYDELGINRYNRTQWFNTNDGSHPNETGRKETAKLISNYLNGMLYD